MRREAHWYLKKFHLLFVTHGLGILSLAKQTFCVVCILLKYVGAICQADLISSMSNVYNCYFHNLLYCNQKQNMIKTINTDFKIKKVQNCGNHLVITCYNNFIGSTCRIVIKHFRITNIHVTKYLVYYKNLSCQNFTHFSNKKSNFYVTLRLNILVPNDVMYLLHLSFF